MSNYKLSFTDVITLPEYRKYFLLRLLRGLRPNQDWRLCTSFCGSGFSSIMHVPLCSWRAYWTLKVANLNINLLLLQLHQLFYLWVCMCVLEPCSMPAILWILKTDLQEQTLLFLIRDEGDLREFPSRDWTGIDTKNLLKDIGQKNHIRLFWKALARQILIGFSNVKKR